MIVLEKQTKADREHEALAMRLYWEDLKEKAAAGDKASIAKLAEIREHASEAARKG